MQDIRGRAKKLILAVRVASFGLDCRACSEAQKIERGCENVSPIPDKWNVEGWSFGRCPLKIITQQSMEYFDAYELYAMGVLPYGDGWLKHSRKFIDAMKIIHREVQKMRVEHARQ